jgi:hypothetical protein
MKFTMSFKFWDGDRNWSGYKATTLLLTCGIISAFVENYWVFTDIPLSEDYDTTSYKIFYMLLQVVRNEALFGAIGLNLDYARSMYLAKERQRQGLLSINDEIEESSSQHSPSN